MSFFFFFFFFSGVSHDGMLTRRRYVARECGHSPFSRLSGSRCWLIIHQHQYSSANDSRWGTNVQQSIRDTATVCCSAAADAADEDAKLWRGAVHRRVLLHDGLSSETPSLTAGFNNNPWDRLPTSRSRPYNSFPVTTIFSMIIVICVVRVLIMANQSVYANMKSEAKHIRIFVKFTVVFPFAIQLTRLL